MRECARWLESCRSPSSRAAPVQAITPCRHQSRSRRTPPPPQNPPPPQLVRASGKLLAKCRAAASTLGYSVPCPTRVPAGLTPTRGSAVCHLDIIGPGGIGGCASSWRGWLVGSSETPDQHLVVVGTPRKVRDFAKVVNGPAWYPAARVRVLRRLTINRWRMAAVYFPPETNEGSAFAHHVVLIWR